VTLLRDGYAPAGGGGANTTNGGNGGRGEVRVWVMRVG
jgi:RNA 3'-terminal phosphate cyclase